MKKIVALLMAMCMMLVLAGCGGNDAKKSSSEGKS